VKQKFISIMFGFLIIQTSFVTAQTLLIPTVEENASIDRPERGDLMSHVEKEFGKPVTKSITIGEPPITKWVYSEITVVFEHRHVIHVVINKK